MKLTKISKQALFETLPLKNDHGIGLIKGEIYSHALHQSCTKLMFDFSPDGFNDLNPYQ